MTDESKEKMKKPELLAPAGDLEKMKTALQFGADAVYFGLPDFSLRARINKFGRTEIKKAAKICRELNKKFYLTINVYAHNRHIEKLPKHLAFIKKIKPDALIISDPGVLQMIKEKLPNQEIHLSTQANATNSEAVKFWADQGINRIILARELNLKEIKEIKKKVPEVELETFVHGAMCMAYSGRCILSKWMTGRSANLGDCAQPCRWQFGIKNQESRIKDININTNKKIRNVVDDQGRFPMDLEEDQNGTYFFNSFDICLIEQLNKLMTAGVDSFKIEGRGKSAYYVAIVTRAYRKVIDAIINKDENLTKIIVQQKKELEKLSHRGYWTGFVLGDEPPHLTDRPYKKTNWEFVGISEARSLQTLWQKKEKEKKIFKVKVHNALFSGDNIKIITPGENIRAKIKKITDDDKKVESAHGGQDKTYKIEFSKKIKPPFLLQRKQDQNKIS